MADTDTQVPETNQEAPTTVDTTSTPTQDNVSSNTDVEALKAQLTKLEMERNLLRKKVDTTSKELEEKTKKELEEKEDYRALAERATAQLAEIQKERDTQERQTAVKTATEEVLKDFDPKVADVAATAGLVVADDSDEAKEQFKTKLQAIAEKIGVTTPPKVNGSNIAPETPQVAEVGKYNTYSSTKGSDWVSRGAVLTQNSKVANDKFKTLESVQAMKKIAGVEPQEI